MCCTVPDAVFSCWTLGTGCPKRPCATWPNPWRKSWRWKDSPSKASWENPLDPNLRRLGCTIFEVAWCYVVVFCLCFSNYIICWGRYIDEINLDIWTYFDLGFTVLLGKGLDWRSIWPQKTEANVRVKCGWPMPDMDCRTISCLPTGCFSGWTSRRANAFGPSSCHQYLGPRIPRGHRKTHDACHTILRSIVRTPIA